MTQEISTDVVLHNQNQPDAFGYQIALVKPTGETYSLSQYVTELNVWESLFAKACVCKIGIFDGAGFIEQVAMQPGDMLRVVMFAHEDGKKLTKTFYINDIGSGARTGNSQAKTYTVSAMTLHAYKNMSKHVYRGMKGVYGEIVQKISKDFMDVELAEVEETYGDITLVSPGKSPFKLISQVMMQAVSARWGVEGSLFFFYEDRDGIRFKTLNSIIADADVHNYILSVDKNVDGTADLRKIQHFVQLKNGSQTERILGGMYENEVVEFDHMSRSFVNVRNQYTRTADQLRMLGGGDIVDKANNIEGFVNDVESTIRGISNLVKFRSSDDAYDRHSEYREKYGYMIAQKAMFNQLIYAIQIFGTTEIKCGDLIDVTAPAISMQSDAPELDKSFQGKFLVGDIRHRIVNGEQFVTVLNLFKDGMETDNVRDASK